MQVSCALRMGTTCNDLDAEPLLACVEVQQTIPPPACVKLDLGLACAPTQPVTPQSISQKRACGISATSTTCTAMCFTPACSTTCKSTSSSWKNAPASRSRLRLPRKLHFQIKSFAQEDLHHIKYIIRYQSLSPTDCATTSLASCQQ